MQAVFTATLLCLEMQEIPHTKNNSRTCIIIMIGCVLWFSFVSLSTFGTCSSLWQFWQTPQCVSILQQVWHDFSLDFWDAAALFPFYPQILQPWCRLHARWKDFSGAIDLNRHRRILSEPISQLLDLSIYQSVDSLYLFLLVRRNCPLSFKLFNTISPSFIPTLPPLLPFSFALDCCEVLHFFFEGETLY